MIELITNIYERLTLELPFSDFLPPLEETPIFANIAEDLPLLLVSVQNHTIRKKNTSMSHIQTKQKTKTEERVIGRIKGGNKEKER